jgi:hypothetical protein
MYDQSIDWRHSFRDKHMAEFLIIQKRGVAMTKLQTVLAGTALAMFAQFAAAQTAGSAATTTAAPIDTSNPAYTDQSRANQSNDPYVKKRVATKEARDEYKADKKAAKETYKEDKKAAKTEMKEAKKEAKETRKAELADPANRNVPQTEPATSTGK